jgi:hypothetical protein
VPDGFLYAATGERWVGEAESSARQLRRVHSGAHITLFTDRPGAVAKDAFDEVVQVPARRWVWTEVKLWAMARSPYERTIYLDTDTHVVGELSEIFASLDRYDFAGVPVPMRRVTVADHADPPEIPSTFQNVNGGVLAWRTNDATRELLDTWWDLFHADLATAGDHAVMDQPSLRVALWRSRCQILLLPSEYNVRTLGYRVRPTTAVGPVRVIHGRPPDVERLARRWNAREDARLLTPWMQYQLRVAMHHVTTSRLPAPLREATASLRRRLAGE